MDNNLLLSNCACRLSTQGTAFVHNLIAGSFTWVGDGTDNGGKRFATNRYTPYHVPHRTEIAGFMTILHGDNRFYNNIFVQQEIREDLAEYAKKMNLEKQFTFVCGTSGFDGYPTAEKYFAQFTDEVCHDRSCRDLFYDHLPVYTGGNVFFNGAKACDSEVNYKEEAHPVSLKVVEKEGAYQIETNLYEYLPKFETPFISTETLGEAFEPEQKFENPDGSQIFFDKDYFGTHRGIHPLCGPFENPESAKEILN